MRRSPVRRSPVRTGPSAAGAALACALALGCGDASEPPNVLLYVSDTLRADGLGCYGNATVGTPNLDRFAKEGVLFERAWAPSSWTRASMGSLLTGTHPAVHGAEGRYDRLDVSATLLSELFARAGYATANVLTNPNVGTDFGFAQGWGAFLELYEGSWTGDNVVRVEELGALADETTRVAIEWLESVSEPFFLVVHTIDPHSPYTPPTEWDLYGGGLDSRVDGTQRSLHQLVDPARRRPVDEARVRSLYYGEIAFNDDAFGALVGWLDARGLYDRTVVAFTSDHGEEFWEHGVRGHGKSLHEEALHVPLVLRYPAALGRGERRGGAVSTVDLGATLLDLAGLERPPWLDGASLVERRDADVPLFASCRLQKLDLHSVRDGRWKLVWDRKERRRALYDMEDAGEARDVRREHPDVAARLFEELGEHLAGARDRRLALHGGGDVPQAELTDEMEEALGALGYHESEEAEREAFEEALHETEELPDESPDGTHPR